MALPPPPPEEPPPPPVESAGEPSEDICPRCGTPYAPDQEYCLECGLRLPFATGVSARLGTTWRKRLPWYPGDWIWPALLGLVIAAAGAAAAIAFSRDGTAATATVVATTPIMSTTTTTPSTLPTAPEATIPRTTTRPRPKPPPPRKTLVAWPGGRSGWTNVLASLPATRGLQAARAQALRALAAGAPNVGVLDSSRYSSLHPGYYVVFSGIYGSFTDADRARGFLRARGYASAYSRPITP